MYLGGQVQELGRYLPEVLYRNRVLVPVVQEEACALDATPLNHLHTFAQSQVSCCNIVSCSVPAPEFLDFPAAPTLYTWIIYGQKPAKSLSLFFQKCSLQISYPKTSLIPKIRIVLRILNPLNLWC